MLFETRSRSPKTDLVAEGPDLAEVPSPRAQSAPRQSAPPLPRARPPRRLHRLEPEGRLSSRRP